MLYVRHGDTYVVRFEDEEAFPGRFVEFLSSESIGGGSFTGIGAMLRTRISYFDTDAKQYLDRDIEEQVEVLSLVGNVAQYEGEPLVHAHIVLSRRDYTVLGGHLRQGIVRPTLEVTLHVASEPLHRAADPKFGLPGLDLMNRY